MRLFKQNMPRDFKLHIGGDVHIHNPAHSKDLWAQNISECMDDESAYMIVPGDIIEAVMSDDFRYSQEYDKEGRSSFITDQINEAVRCLTPLAKDGKIISLNEGNHERKHLRYGPIVKQIVFRLNELAGFQSVEYGGYTSKITFNDRYDDLMFKMFVTHGSRSLKSAAKDPIQKRANQQASLKNMLAPLAGDCAIMIMGHTHGYHVVKPEDHVYLYDDDGEIKAGRWRCEQTELPIHPDHRWYCNTGSFLKTQMEDMDTYSEIAMYPPLECAYPVVEVEDGIIIDIRKVMG